MDHSGQPVPELVALVDELESVHPDFDVPHRVIAILGDTKPSSWQKSVIDIVDREPREALLGFTAPPEMWAIGTLSSGWAAPVEDRDDLARGRTPMRPSAHPDACRMRMISITTRTGLTVARVAMADGRRHEQVTDRADADVGVVAESVRRALGLPTAPAGFPPSELITSIWLNDVAGAAADAMSDGRVLTWDQLARLHPALQMLKLAGRHDQPAELVAGARALGRVLTWETVQQQCADRAWLATIVEPEVARWMDGGMLARWLISHFPPIDHLLREATRPLGPDVSRQLLEAVERLVTGDSATDDDATAA